MNRLSAERIAEFSGGATPQQKLPTASGVAYHTGRLKPGDAFFALSGEATHGIQFADDALAAGAAFIVSDRPHPQGVLVSDPAQTLLNLGGWARSEYEGPVIGVTGSAGKTSTKVFLAAALDAPSSPGNLNTPLALAAILTNAYLAQSAPEPLVLELGIDRVGEMARLLEIVRPTHGVLTLIAESHLEGLGSLETVAQEKGALLRAADVGFASTQAAVLLAPDLRQSVTTYGLAPDTADDVGQIIEESGLGQALRFQGVSFTLPYPGRAMALNAVAALSVAQSLDVPLEEAAKRLETVRLEPGRLEIKRMGRARILDDSYNSNPASARQALEVLRTSPAPHTAILGDMLELGETSENLHRALGEQTVGLDRVIAIGNMAYAVAAGNPNVQVAASFGEALPILATLPLEGTLLIKGSRGMRLERVLDVLAKQAVPS